jgi:peptidoglycan/xylan/chitin deacetylase (PgdA/CDA1 family)
MAQSGLVEFGSHTHSSHGYKEAYGVYGIQRRPGESRDAYEARVFSDLQTSIEKIESNLGEPVLYFAYPNGKTDSWAEDFMRENFKVTTTTQVAPVDISNGLYQLTRYNLSVDSRPWQYLPE